MTQPPTLARCSQCGATAPYRGDLLPPAWEYATGLPGTAIWCGPCVGRLLDATLDAMRSTPAGPA